MEKYLLFFILCVWLRGIRGSPVDLEVKVRLALDASNYTDTDRRTIVNSTLYHSLGASTRHWSITGGGVYNRGGADTLNCSKIGGSRQREDFTVHLTIDQDASATCWQLELLDYRLNINIGDVTGDRKGVICGRVTDIRAVGVGVGGGTGTAGVSYCDNRNSTTTDTSHDTSSQHGGGGAGKGGNSSPNGGAGAGGDGTSSQHGGASAGGRGGNSSQLHQQGAGGGGDAPQWQPIVGGVLGGLAALGLLGALAALATWKKNKVDDDDNSAAGQGPNYVAPFMNIPESQSSVPPAGTQTA